MGSEADAEAASTSAVDSDGSVSWEDFFGTSTDLVPQLLGMFDELARRGTGAYGDHHRHHHHHHHHHHPHHHVVLPSPCTISASVLQKRLSLVQQQHSRRGSTLFGQQQQISNGVIEDDQTTPTIPSTPTTTPSTQTTSTTSAKGILRKDTNVSREEDQEEDEEEEEEEYEENSNMMPDQDEKLLDLQPLARRRRRRRSSSDVLHDIKDKNDKDEDENYRVLSLSLVKDKSLEEKVVNVNGTGSGSYRRESTGGLSSFRYNRRCRAPGRPLSGSSIASSTSSSGCSNQGNACTANPYLASVESLADTCASSQGSGDSGVVIVSEASCRLGNVTSGQRRDSGEGEPLCHRPRYCDPHRNPVERVLLEIVDTEAIYVEHLRQVIQGYLIFWRDDPETFAHQLQLGDLFSNIEDIFEFNREFLKEIEKCGLDPVRVANTFIKHNSGFKVYTEYCTNYPRTVSVLTDLMGQEEKARGFRERQAALGHALPLGSFLLKPVQRILKYHLLLENLSKEYGGADCEARDENEVEGRNAIEAALAAMTGIAKHINAMKRRHEHAVRVQEIQSLLYGWPGPDLTTSGELVAEGRFRIRGAKAPRHAFLFDKMLLLTKKKEDGLLVYKAHIMCSDLMLIESIPGEPLSFHVIPFNNPRLQYTLQARNLEQKREWSLQIKRVILENYNAVIPSHARQLVLQLGQTQAEDDALADKSSAKKQHSAPPEYLEKRKQERERRRSETGLRQKFKRGSRKSETSVTSIDDSPTSSSCKNHAEESPIIHDCKEQNLNKSSESRASKVKDRFAGWRRKSEPGFQSYVCLNQSDDEEKEEVPDTQPLKTEIECVSSEPVEKEDPTSNSSVADTKENNEQQPQAQTVEEIVGHIVMQKREFQKLLEKQRTNSIINVRQQQRFNKHIAVDSSDDSDSENANYNKIESSNNNRAGRLRNSHRDQRMIRTNNAWNSLSSTPTRDNQPSLQLLYDNFKTGNNKGVESSVKNKVNRVHEKKALFEAFKRQSIVTESKIIKTALRIRENSTTAPELNTQTLSQMDNTATEEESKVIDVEKVQDTDESKGFGNYDNLQHVWEGLHMEKDIDGNDSPTQPAVWLTKLCEGLPTTPPKCGSLPRSFQINVSPQPCVTKARFLQRDGKPMNERPFTIASDKPAEINLEDMERYALSCQPEERIAKFPTSASTSASTFFYSLDDTLTDAYSDVRISPTTTNIHPDHKIYRANGSGSTIFKNVLSKAGNRLQGLRNTVSTETLECSEELERTKYFRSLSTGKLRKKGKLKQSRETSSDIDEIIGCVAGGPSDLRVPSLYYKQGSSSLGARIAQSDYADPTILFCDTKRTGPSAINTCDTKGDTREDNESFDNAERRERETDSFYEKCFEEIESYVDADVDDAFRDSAIFSDLDDVLVIRPQGNIVVTETPTVKNKVGPPVPAKKNSEFVGVTYNANKYKPSVARKPDYLKIKSVFPRGSEVENKIIVGLSTTTDTLYDCRLKEDLQNNRLQNNNVERDDVSTGQSQVGWVRKIVGQFQGQLET